MGPKAKGKGAGAMEKGRPGVFAVLGGDGRQAAAAAALGRAGYAVTGPEGLAAADYLLLPAPLPREAAALLQKAKPGAVAFGGRVSAEAAAAAEKAGVTLLDYLAREELARLNAVPTAEGCISLLLQNRPRTIWGSRALVLGFGRCGAALAERLAALGAKVTVFARGPAARALAKSRNLGAAGPDRLDGALTAAEIVVNTIPAPVLTEKELRKLPGGALVVDLASLPGGTDFEAARARGVRAIHALSLPARCAPVTAGELVAGTVLDMLTERGEDR